MDTYVTFLTVLITFSEQVSSSTTTTLTTSENVTNTNANLTPTDTTITNKITTMTATDTTSIPNTVAALATSSPLSATSTSAGNATITSKIGSASTSIMTSGASTSIMTSGNMSPTSTTVTTVTSTLQTAKLDSTTKTVPTTNEPPSLATSDKPVTDSDHGNKVTTPPCTGCSESRFGKYGLPVSIGMAVLCVILVIVIVVLATRSRQKQAPDDERNMPRLKMLEIKDSENKRTVPAQDDLHTYSLDYEKHVQEKIEEHKRGTSFKEQKPPAGGKPGVSTFMLAKKASLKSTISSSSTAPSSPLSPTTEEGKPLIQPPDDEEAIAFNFNAKRPSELLTARRTSNLDNNDRRKSNASSKGRGRNSDIKVDV